MDRVVLVTGASRGIGAAIAEKFARMGDRVVINYHQSETAAAKLLSKIEAFGGIAMLAKANVSNPDDVCRLFCETEEKWGSVDVLIHNAGISQQKLFQDISNEDWNRMIGIHLNGAFYTARRALPEMISRKYGQILFISSMWGISGGSCEVHYSAAKAGMIGLTKALAKEVGLSGIRVNCIAPGVIQTEMNAHHSAETLRILAEETPLGKLGSVEDVANTAWFLASEDASFITGQTISVDGGIIL